MTVCYTTRSTILWDHEVSAPSDVDNMLGVVVTQCHLFLTPHLLRMTTVHLFVQYNPKVCYHSNSRLNYLHLHMSTS